MNAHCSFNSLEDTNELLNIKLGPFPIDRLSYWESCQLPGDVLPARVFLLARL